MEKLEISACALGFARACVDEAWRYAEEREQFDVPASRVVLELTERVVVEDIETRIGNGTPPKEAAVAAGGQFFIPLAVASITTVSAFIPMLILEGSTGEFAFSLGAVVAIMLAGSIVLTFAVHPVTVLRGLPARLITSLPHRLRLFEKAGVETVDAEDDDLFDFASCEPRRPGSAARRTRPSSGGSFRTGSRARRVS